MEKKIRLEISEYSMNPGPRYIEQGEDSGEDFYHNCLNKKFQVALSEKAQLIVDLDGPNGYASSFLDEAFGNLVYDFGLNIVKNNIQFISKEEPEWIQMIENATFKEWENRRIENRPPKKTAPHEPWYIYKGTSAILNKGYEV